VIGIFYYIKKCSARGAKNRKELCGICPAVKYEDEI